MQVITKKEFLDNKEGHIKKIKAGSIFIYPTDTLYGIGCDAGNESIVKKIREVKQTDQPFSVIAPSKDWIKQNLEYLPGFDQWLDLGGRIDGRCPSRLAIG